MLIDAKATYSSFRFIACIGEFSLNSFTTEFNYYKHTRLVKIKQPRPLPLLSHGNRIYEIFRIKGCQKCIQPTLLIFHNPSSLINLQLTVYIYIYVRSVYYRLSQLDLYINGWMDHCFEIFIPRWANPLKVFTIASVFRTQWNQHYYGLEAHKLRNWFSSYFNGYPLKPNMIKEVSGNLRKAGAQSLFEANFHAKSQSR